ncbi:MAG: HAD family hydrolase [Chloroflexi bacterium RBG_16_57_8]|nr:MAG: HAD family hydrolase [Chloroflexi bacterium RBG_16_57_8]
MDEAPIWSLTVERALSSLSTSREGLSAAEADSRLKKSGYNELPEPRRRPAFLRFAGQLTHLIAILLWLAGALAFVAGMPELGWAVWAVIIINAVFTFWQEYRAERTLAQLKKRMPAQAKVFRGNQVSIIPARQLVPGDIIQLEEGDRIPADSRLIEAHQFGVDVSVLTGESAPVLRHAYPLSFVAPGVVDAENLVLAGTAVTSGRGVAVVYATGAHNELGKIAHLAGEVKRTASTLERQVATLVRTISALAVGMGAAVFLLGYFVIRMDVTVSLLFAIGIIVANVPEGLLPTVTLALAMGVRRMAGRNALVRRLSAVETLGSTTVICTDKTGTITRNEVTAQLLWIPEQAIEVTGSGYGPEGAITLPTGPESARQVQFLLYGGAVCNNASLLPPDGRTSWRVLGDPTEGALLVAAAKAGIDLRQLPRPAERVQEFAFDPHRRMMSAAIRRRLQQDWIAETPYVSFTKGDPQELVKRCSSLLRDSRPAPLAGEDRKRIMSEDDNLASRGFRVMGVAFRGWDTDPAAVAPEEMEHDLTFIGLIAMIDPPRPEVSDAIKKCIGAGIAVSMITGDHAPTAKAIAQQVGLWTDGTKVVTGAEIESLPDAEFRRLFSERDGLVFAHVNPEQKLKIVRGYRAAGHVVAVTGDGANDAPALRAADIGVAMGISGTDVAREAADMILLDDNFATIVSAVEEGRAIYNNIRKFMTYILTSNVPEIVPFVAMVILRIPPALTILQILAVDLGTDIVPALGLGAERAESGTMQQRPRPAKKALLDVPLLARAYGFLGVIEAAGAMTAFFSVWWLHGYSFGDLQAIAPGIIGGSADATVTAIYRQATAATLTAIVIAQIGNVLVCRSDRMSIFKIGVFSNPLVWIGVITEVVLIFAIVYAPPLQRIFSTAWLPATLWLSLVVWPLLLLLAEEMRKGVVRRISKARA